MEAVKDGVRDVGWESIVDRAAKDVMYALRLLRKSPGFTSVAILSLALGIGANTAVFQVMDAVRMRPLPVAHPEQLVEIRMVDPTSGRMGILSGRRPQFTYAMWKELQQRQEAFSGVVAWSAVSIHNMSQPP